ncbi:NADP-dependent oxidoreductase [Frondihabitans peucedani]|uniref:NADP-dependent oxidoreductase n=2 Tax=Frondihabitans peucedani TaxID=598626 RepID=A0ABP8E1F1_9MICO
MSNCVGLVVASRDERAPVGTQVATYSGWTEYATLRLEDNDLADPDMGDERDWIQTLGTPGVTALIGLRDVARLQGGEVVAISGAAGAVGGVAVQVAKAAGARVISIAGGPSRVRHTVDTLGADLGLDYTSPDFDEQLAQASAGGIDIFFDNVGGKLLERMIGHLGTHGRAVISGTISTYAGGSDNGITIDTADLLLERKIVQAFNVGDHYAASLLPARETLAAGIRNGSIKTVVTEYDGLGSAPEALAAVFRSGSGDVGKRIVRIGY